MLQLVRLNDDYPISSFDCGDEDLNDFRLLMPNDPNEHTKTMFFDMFSLSE